MIFLHFLILLTWVANMNSKIHGNDFDKVLFSAEKEFAGKSWTKKNSLHSHRKHSGSNPVGFTLTPGLSITKDETAAGFWNHERQNEWVRLSEQCGGTNQSPINIDSNNASIAFQLTCLYWQQYNQSSWELVLENTGHSLHAYATSWAAIRPILIGTYLLGNYVLDAIHWHWGDSSGHGGSEHRINNKTCQLEMHLVKYKSTYENISHAIASGSRDALLVVAFLYEIGDKSDDGIIAITEAMKNAKANGKQNTTLPLKYLVDTFQDGYYIYYGSLTTPACNQIVRWIVSESIKKIAIEQLQVFQSLLVNGRPLVNNFRSLQPVNNRQILHVTYCMDYGKKYNYYY